MTVVVPDASVVLKWVLQRDDETDSATALRLLDEYLAERVLIRLPSLWRYEVGNILGLKRPDIAGEAMEVLLGYEFPEEALDRAYCLAVLDFMKDMAGVSFSDASYHVLAIRTGGVYVTTDDAYVERASRRRNVVRLADWPAARRRPRS